MSYFCYAHNWASANYECPSCHKERVVYTVSDSIIKMSDHKTICESCESIYTQAAKRIEQLEQKLAVAVKALEFYADPFSWNDFNTIYSYDVINDDDRAIPDGLCDYRGGKRAREALAKIGGIK